MVSSRVFGTFSGRLLYVANSGDDTISGYLITRSNGALTAISNSPYSATAGPVSVVTDPEGSDAFVSTNNQLLNFAVAVNTSPYGSLSGGASQTAGTTSQGIAVLPSGLGVYVASEGSNSIFASRFAGSSLDVLSWPMAASLRTRSRWPSRLILRDASCTQPTSVRMTFRSMPSIPTALWLRSPAGHRAPVLRPTPWQSIHRGTSCWSPIRAPRIFRYSQLTREMAP